MHAARVRAAGPTTAVAATALALTAVSGRAGGQAVSCAPIPLRDALEQLAARTGVRLSYSRELIAVDRPVCALTGDQPVLAAFDALLRGTGVEAVSVGGGQIVLAPSAHATGDAAGPASRAAVLDRVVVTGSSSGAPSRALPVALSVVDGTTLGPRAAASLATALDGVVPGLWLWSQPTTTLLGRYAGLRGASSFGLTTPKLYLDGVEVANPLFVTALAPDQVERIEVIRGPQGAALYGADAISGVLNIVTRHDGVEDGRALTIRSSVGAAATAFAAGPAFAQDHRFTLRMGAGARTGGLSVGLTTLGAVVPGNTARQLTAVADARRVGPSGVWTFTARFADASAPPGDSLVGSIARFTRPDTGGHTPSAQHLSQLTLATTGVRATGGRWTQTLTAGIDGYRVSGLAATDMAALLPGLDTAQGTARGLAARGTLRASTTATYDLARDVAVTVTGIADYGLLHEATRPDTSANAPLDTLSHRTTRRFGTEGTAAWGTAAAAPATWLGTAGLVGQTTVAWRDAVFITAGLRGERNDGFTVASRTALLPSLGVSAVRTVGGATLKLRTAYGSGLRPVRSAARSVAWHAFRDGALPNSLAPESQTGIEGGADLFVGRTAGEGGAGTTLAVHLTGFDQQASGLVQQVALPRDRGAGVMPPYGPGTPPMRRDSMPHAPNTARQFDYVLQNVGAISNRGVEGETQLRVARAGAGVFTFGGTLTYVDSRVRRTASGYEGELRAGDRMLEVPRWTLGATAGWRAAGWGTTVGAARAANWINYSRLALSAAAPSDKPDAFLTGAGLRAYWRTYAGVTRLRADVSHDLSRGLSAVLTGENLLNVQLGEPDDATKLPGRTLTIGVRARF